MNKEINITETEWKVMEVLWQKPRLTIGEIKNALSDMGWSDSTVKTLVRRLTQKAAVGIDDTAGQFIYYPLVSEDSCRKRETKSLIDRIYHGSVKMLMTSLVSDSDLTEDDAKRLMEIIDKMEEGSK